MKTWGGDMPLVPLWFLCLCAFAFCKQSKTGAGEGLGMRLDVEVTKSYSIMPQLKKIGTFDALRCMRKKKKEAGRC